MARSLFKNCRCLASTAFRYDLVSHWLAHIIYSLSCNESYKKLTMRFLYFVWHCTEAVQNHVGFGCVGVSTDAIRYGWIDELFKIAIL